MIELVIVMLIISSGALGLAAAYGNAARSLTINETLQQAAQYGQECAENALATRHDLGYGALASFTCGNPVGFTRTVAITNPYNGAACPSGVTCMRIVITTTSTSNATLNSSIAVMFVSY